MPVIRSGGMVLKLTPTDTKEKWYQVTSTTMDLKMISPPCTITEIQSLKSGYLCLTAARSVLMIIIAILPSIRLMLNTASFRVILTMTILKTTSHAFTVMVVTQRRHGFSDL